MSHYPPGSFDAVCCFPTPKMWSEVLTTRSPRSLCSQSTVDLLLLSEWLIFPRFTLRLLLNCFLTPYAPIPFRFRNAALFYVSSGSDPASSRKSFVSLYETNIGCVPLSVNKKKQLFSLFLVFIYPVELETQGRFHVLLTSSEAKPGQLPSR